MPLISGQQVEFEAVSILRVRALLARYPRIVPRVFTPAEIEFCRRRKRWPDQHFAARLAAKFAVRRLLGGGRLAEIEVFRDPLGWPSPRFHGRAAMLARGHRIHLSLSHDGDLAAAYAATEVSL